MSTMSFSISGNVSILDRFLYSFQRRCPRDLVDFGTNLHNDDEELGTKRVDLSGIQVL